MLDTTTVIREGFNPKTAAMEESLFALGNGYIGWRGNYEENYETPIGVEGCYINAFYETEKIRYGEIAYAYAEDSQTMLNITSSQRILLEEDGVALHPEKAISTVRKLDMMAGVLFRTTVYPITGGKLTVQVNRLISQKRDHAAIIAMTLTADTDCSVTVKPLIDGDVTNLVVTDDPRVGSGLHGRVLSEPVMAESGKAFAMVQHTGNTHLAEACAMAVTCSDGTKGHAEKTQWQAAVVYDLQLKAGISVTIEKAIAYHSGTQEEEQSLIAAALATAEEVSVLGYAAMAAEQKAYMDAYWQNAGIWVDGDDVLLQGLRFNMYHLLQSAGRDGKRNAAAKGLTGEGYEGHYFWDTETYIFPMFLHVAPKIARSLLEYRYSILPKARERARQMSHPTGALFPWRTIGGYEASAYYPAGTAQIHIDADIAMAVKRYWQATGDDEFLATMGAEIVCETARFFRDWGFYNPNRGGAFCLNCVTGPDEYNCLVNNNTYTNLMAADNMRFAAEAVAYLEEHMPTAAAALKEKIALTDGETAEWLNAAEHIYICRDAEKKLVWQDDGFMDRQPWPIESIPKENFPLLIHYHPLEIYRHQICKQADTVLAGLLIPGVFSHEESINNFDFYDKVTTHDSSLSKAAYSAAAARIGKLDKAYSYFRDTAIEDLENHHGNTRDGLHLANMAGSWMCMVTGFGGMQITKDGISFDPVLPAGLKGYGFCAAYQGRVINVHVTNEGVSYHLLSGEAIEITDRGQKITIA